MGIVGMRNTGSLGAANPLPKTGISRIGVGSGSGSGATVGSGAGTSPIWLRSALIWRWNESIRDSRRNTIAATFPGPALTARYVAWLRRDVSGDAATLSAPQRESPLIGVCGITSGFTGCTYTLAQGFGGDDAQPPVWADPLVPVSLALCSSTPGMKKPGAVHRVLPHGEVTWYAREDSNLWPLAPEASALSTELRARTGTKHTAIRARSNRIPPKPWRFRRNRGTIARLRPIRAALFVFPSQVTRHRVADARAAERTTIGVDSVERRGSRVPAHPSPQCHPTRHHPAIDRCAAPPFRSVPRGVASFFFCSCSLSGVEELHGY